MDNENNLKLVPLYFPQFHAIPENNEWWGEGFTDWVNVKKGRPQYRGHYQPRVPLGKRYYDQSQKEVIQWQIELAKRYGIYGFCHYHYWFDGKQLLETPTNIMMSSKELVFPFCLAWANETWSRRWDGRDHHILIKQTHIPEKERWLKHFNYLIKAWRDDRAIKIDGKPVFLIYRSHRIDQIGNMFDFWREQAHQAGLDGLYFIAIKQYEFPIKEVLKHFDAVMQFQPFEAIYSPDFNGPILNNSQWFQSLRRLPESILERLRSLRASFSKSLTFYDYDQVWEQIVANKHEQGMTTFPGAFMDWDNSSRYKSRATIYRGASPERFEYWFRRLVEAVLQRPDHEHMIFINAWNEWAEGAYLEPDERYQYQYLEAIERVLSAFSQKSGEEDRPGLRALSGI
jgi:hypothetical protein